MGKKHEKKRKKKRGKVKHTMSGGAVVVNEGRVAVVRQRNDVWSLPKGHLEKGETAEDAARRETEEETGIHEMQLVRPLGVYERPRIGLETMDDPSEMKTIHMFLFTTDQEGLAPEDEKILEARWVPTKEVASLLTHPRDQHFYKTLNWGTAPN